MLYSPLIHGFFSCTFRANSCGWDTAYPPPRDSVRCLVFHPVAICVPQQGMGSWTTRESPRAVVSSREMMDDNDQELFSWQYFRTYSGFILVYLGFILVLNWFLKYKTNIIERTYSGFIMVFEKTRLPQAQQRKTSSSLAEYCFILLNDGQYWLRMIVTMLSSDLAGCSLGMGPMHGPHDPVHWETIAHRPIQIVSSSDVLRHHFSSFWSGISS